MPGYDLAGGYPSATCAGANLFAACEQRSCSNVYTNVNCDRNSYTDINAHRDRNRHTDADEYTNADIYAHCDTAQLSIVRCLGR